jgi:hypothetical protein
MELWTLKETASKTRLSEAYWRKQVWGRPIAVVKVGRTVRLDSEVVRAFLDARIRPAKPQKPMSAEACRWPTPSPR